MQLIFRKARAADLAAIVDLLVDDDLGRQREAAGRDLAPYQRAFDEIDADGNQLLCVAERDGQVVGTLQLSFLRGLSRGGARRGQIEAVRVARAERSKGLGGAMIRWAVETCRAEGCVLVQLTTDTSRHDAHRFYDRLGFEATHIGYKLSLDTAGI
jgi:GNAT superfamily N-acetyltransferase